MIIPDLKIAGVIPAAGRSGRMGCDKRLLQIGGMTLIEMTVTRLVQAGCVPVVVVLEPDSPCSMLKGLNKPQIIVVNLSHPSPTMRATICAGLRSLPSQIDAVAVMPADCPLVSTNVINSILMAYMRQRPLLFVPSFKGQQGHPRILAKQMFADLYAMPEEDRFSSIFTRKSDLTVWYETSDSSILEDCDTPSDYEAILNQWKKQNI